MSCVRFSVAKHKKTAIGKQGTSHVTSTGRPGHVGDHIGPSGPQERRGDLERDARRRSRRDHRRRGRIAARRPLPAVHGAFRAQHPRQGQPREQGLGGRRAEGRVLHGVEGQGAGEGGIVAKDMESKKLEAAKCLGEAIGETTTYLLDDYPREHRRRIRTNNMIERLNREIRRGTRVVGSFPDGRSALMLICARIRYVTSNEWSTRRYLDMSRLGENVRQRTDHRHRDAKTKVRKIADTTFLPVALPTYSFPLSVLVITYTPY